MVVLYTHTCREHRRSSTARDFMSRDTAKIKIAPMTRQMSIAAWMFGNFINCNDGDAYAMDLPNRSANTKSSLLSFETESSENIVIKGGFERATFFLVSSPRYSFCGKSDD